jgi:hypothetical protein
MGYVETESNWPVFLSFHLQTMTRSDTILDGREWHRQSNPRTIFLRCLNNSLEFCGQVFHIK